MEDLQDKMDALVIYGGEEIKDIVEALPDVNDSSIQVPEGEQVTNFHRVLHKLDNHFTPMANKDSARSTFENLKQDGHSLVQNYIIEKRQAEKTQFPDKDDAI